MKKAYIVGEEGFYIDDYIYEEGQKLEGNIITTEYISGLYKPKWNGNEWVEGATQEYIDSMNPVIIQEPSIDDRLQALEMAILDLI